MKNLIINIGKKHHWFMSISRGLKIKLNRLKYLYYFFTNKVDSNIIIFESYMGRNYSDSPKAIYLEMLGQEKYKNMRFIWMYKPKCEDKFLELCNNKNTIIVKQGTSDYYRYYAKAKYFILNSRLNEAIIKKKNQIYVQCWHGTPLKKLGYDIEVTGGNALNTVKDIRKKYKSDSLKYNYMISPSEFCTNKFISAFNLEDKSIIKEIGYPRNDYLINYKKKDVDRIKKQVKLPKNKKVILYAPTWRDNQHQTGLGYTYDLNVDFDKLKLQLSDKYVILFRSHYFVANSFNFDRYKGFVYNVSDYNDINELYIISDLLITDYSSVFFDYANLNKPMIFYMYDFDEYKNKLRDFYIKLDELPGPIVKTDDELINEIFNYNMGKFQKKYKLFNKKYNYLDDGKASKRAIDEFIQK